MANYSVNFAKHATLSSSVVDTVTLSESSTFVVVTNRATTGAGIFFTLGDLNTGVATPAVAGDDTYVLMPGMVLIIPFDGTSTVVKFISADAQPYSVMVIG